MEMTVPTSWLDLDWDNPDPWDIRYYESLILALNERIYKLPLVPLPEGVAPNHDIYYQYTRLGEYKSYYPWTYFHRYDAPKRDILWRIISWLLKVLGKYYFYSPYWASYSSPAAGGFLTEIGADYLIGNYDAGGVYIDTKYLYNDPDLSKIFQPPVYGMALTNDRAKEWLLAMKSTIQRLRYIHLPNCSFHSYDECRLIDNDYYYIDEYTEDEAIAKALSTRRSIDGLTHDVAWPNAYFRCVTKISKGYYESRAKWTMRMWRRDGRWVNQFAYPVRVYGCVRGYDPWQYGYQHYHDYGTGWQLGDVIDYGIIQPGGELASVLDMTLSPFPTGAAFVLNESHFYNLFLHLYADLGEGLNFNSVD